MLPSCRMAEATRRRPRTIRTDHTDWFRALTNQCFPELVEDGYFLGLQAFLALGNGVFNTLPFLQHPVSIALNRAEVDEHVTAGVAGNKTKAFAGKMSSVPSPMGAFLRRVYNQLD